ncbi:uncharacterized protein J4E87_004495 [Alternaria ethzedia]|uniref:uncharacterized protein n=1 Tax=Alternaria ethzedia TaxID=181014 RepID=UPI0020C245A8|nr:uncharacterized protein J4E87_004495 [Alternaria ethzedia]KAI4627153.1 hypothetical protein J4E87_004495 [Alternaria ethzedia]
MTEDNGPHGLRWWGGHIMTKNAPVRLLPPNDPIYRYPPEDDEEQPPWRLPPGKGRPQHDCGRLGLPFDSNLVAQAEPIDNLLDQNLGDTLFLRTKGSSLCSSGFRPVAGPLFSVTAGRLKRLCTTCSATEVKHQCTCTLRKRFLDRWLCIECYLENEAKPGGAAKLEMLAGDEPGECPCGSSFDAHDQDSWLVCEWCDGRVTGSKKATEEEEMAKDFVPNEEDEDKEGAWPEQLSDGDRPNLDGNLIDQAIVDAGSVAPRGLHRHFVCHEWLTRKQHLQMAEYKKKMEEGKEEEFNFYWSRHWR